MKPEIISYDLDNGDQMILLKDGTKLIVSKADSHESGEKQHLVRKGTTKNKHRFIVSERISASTIFKSAMMDNAQDLRAKN